MSEVAEITDRAWTPQQVALNFIASFVAEGIEVRRRSRRLPRAPEVQVRVQGPARHRTIVAAWLLELTDLMKDPSILILSNGNARRFDSDE